MASIIQSLRLIHLTASDARRPALPLARGGRSFVLPALTLAGLCVTGSATAQSTWADARTTPALTEVVAIDATGEEAWLYGYEDVAGDGPQFKQQEQSIDVRTAYAKTDTSFFWVRVYVSDVSGSGGNVTAYVFIDTDQNTATGGTAAAPELNAKFTQDSSPGGYDYVIQIRGNNSITDLWAWDAGQSKYVAQAVPATDQAVAEAATDIDPILVNYTVGEVHGYLQAKVAQGLIGLTPACDANIFVRSVSAAASAGDGDLEVGTVAPCKPADANANGVPDVVEPDQPCQTDAECPGGGVCVNGECDLGFRPCVTDTDCLVDEECAPDTNLCTPKSSGACTTNADCPAELVCNGGTCGPCDPNAAVDLCDPNERCGSDGRCINLGDPCTVDTDCATDFICDTAKGYCVAKPVPCTSNLDCEGGRACIDGNCGFCTSDSQCTAPDICTPSSVCGPAVTGGGGGGAGGAPAAVADSIQGGAFNCAASHRSGSGPAAALALFVAALAAPLRRRSRKSGRRS